MLPPPIPPRRGLRRREALAAGAGAALAVGLAACGGGGDETSASQPNSELNALADLTALEYLAIKTYATATRFSPPGQARELGILSRQATDHVDALDALIAAGGGMKPPATPAPGVVFVDSAETARSESLRVATRLVHSYSTAIPLQSSAATRSQLTTMLANNAQHQVMLGGLGQARVLPGGVDVGA